ncbi:MAG: hypothetical protein ACE5JB_04455 [bacterium]
MNASDIRVIEFKQLLDICVNPRHNFFQNAWNEFESRYRTIILGRIRKYLNKWSKSNNVDIVHEISSSVTMRLIKNDFKALKQFREREHEGKFINFLNVICRHTAHSYMMEIIKKDEFYKEVEGYASHRFLFDHPDIAEDIYDFLVNSLRRILSKTHKSPYHQERDILIYLLRIIAGFKAKEVAQIPLLNITQGNVDNIMNRLLSFLK